MIQIKIYKSCSSTNNPYQYEVRVSGRSNDISMTGMTLDDLDTFSKVLKDELDWLESFIEAENNND